MPINIFLSSSLLVSELGFHDRYPGDYRGRQTISQTSDWGMTGHFSAGKEWWGAVDWGLGFAGDVLLGRMGGHDASYTIKGFALLLSSSFN